MNCTTCGAPNPPGARFCTNCRSPLGVPVATSPAARGILKAGLPALAAFAAVVGIGLLAWFAFLKPDAPPCPPGSTCLALDDASPGPPASPPATTAPPGTTPPPTTPPPTTPPTTAPPTTTPPPTTPPPTATTPPPPPPDDERVTVSLKVCDRVSDAGDCFGPGLHKSKYASWAVWFRSDNAAKGDVLKWMLVDPDTGQPGSAIYEHTLADGDNINITPSSPLYYDFRGEFMAWFNGNLVEFKKPNILVVD